MSDDEKHSTLRRCGIEGGGGRSAPGIPGGAQARLEAAHAADDRHRGHRKRHLYDEKS